MTDASESTEDLVYRTFELAAERVDDIVEPVYRRYFARDPEAAALMSHMDHLTLGRMLNEVMRLLMSSDYAVDASYLDFEVKNHEWAYRVQSRMYSELLASVRETVAEVLGSEWNAACAAAWDERVARLLEEIEQRTSAA